MIRIRVDVDPHNWCGVSLSHWNVSDVMALWCNLVESLLGFRLNPLLSSSPLPCPPTLPCHIYHILPVVLYLLLVFPVLAPPSSLYLILIYISILYPPYSPLSCCLLLLRGGGDPGPTKKLGDQDFLYLFLFFSPRPSSFHSVSLFSPCPSPLCPSLGMGVHVPLPSVYVSVCGPLSLSPLSISRYWGPCPSPSVHISVWGPLSLSPLSMSRHGGPCPSSLCPCLGMGVPVPLPSVHVLVWGSLSLYIQSSLYLYLIYIYIITSL